MRVWHGLESIRDPLDRSTVAIGAFDGIHRGHQALIGASVGDALLGSRRAVVFTFDRQPAELVAPDRSAEYLSTPEQRAELIADLGVDDLVVARFDERFRSHSPESFLHFVVVGVLGAEAVYVGPDFRFGHDQAGDIDYLRDAQERLGFRVTVLDPVLVDGERAGSTRIRELIKAGDLSRALGLLGHPYVLRGRVVEGRRLGRTLGYPTANLELSTRQVVPADGIYATWVERKGSRYKGACSIGVRPTVDGTGRTIEVYLLGFDGDLYGETLDMEFVGRLREERRFDSLEELADQIGRDAAQVDELLNA